MALCLKGEDGWVYLMFAFSFSLVNLVDWFLFFFFLN